MNHETVELGKIYECQPVGLQEKVTGEVVKKLENCVILHVERFNHLDSDVIAERGGKVVVRYEEIYGKKVATYFFS